ncbi:aldo/keto reductase [Chitinophaga qingshengii]|uniref:Aldo/keto reductase n=1 Tax=Chitinophaga qingshengii TaxID=1569794 RepID=A0ABR7TQE7_9BACT|nr:aldo/keto reductase [Chitinophaga qingshengii]MBC9932701.1 aldo/keto reductase [Chitinophaga qingshengii]
MHSSLLINGQPLPALIFGTSGLGNLFVSISEQEKTSIVKECIRCSPGMTVFDTAGKYGAGLALETLGAALKELQADRSEIIISNKLGWYRTELKTPEPLFEPGVWKDLQHDAVQRISYQGIIECFEQGNELLGGFIPQMVSVHDPDEYLARAKDTKHRARLYDDILQAYQALFDLKEKGLVAAVGIGAKDWRVLQQVAGDIPLDWMMVANSLTVFTHPPELLSFIEAQDKKGVHVINSAVYHSGFLLGSDYFDYHKLDRSLPGDAPYFEWRDRFFRICADHQVKPAEACLSFGLQVRGVRSVAVNTTKATRVSENFRMLDKVIPPAFWEQLWTAE